MITNRKDRDVAAETGNAAGWVDDFAQEFAGRIVDARWNLAVPFEACCLAWTYEHEPENDWICDLRDSFPEWLANQCGRTPKALIGDSSKAFGVFFACLCALFELWRTEPPVGEWYGGAAAHWCVQHPEVFSRVQAATRARSGLIRIGRADWTTVDVVKHGPKGPPKAEKLELTTTLEFSGQRTWVQAATTAAYALFGDFLMHASESTGFCMRCAKPFLIGKKTTFCSLRCACNYSAVRSRESRDRLARRKKFRKAAKALEKWLQAPPKVRSDWREYVQKTAGMQTRDGRRNRTLGGYIQAAGTAPASRERDALLGSLLGPTDVSGSKEISQEREKLQRELETFLSNIQTAEEIRERQGHK